MTPGQKIKALREKKGLTQTELAEELLRRYPKVKEFSRQNLVKWETDVNAFGWEAAKAICRYFDITLDQLIFENKSIRKLESRQPFGTVRQ